MGKHLLANGYSNTTLVKVKCRKRISIKSWSINSNTTLVKVKLRKLNTFIPSYLNSNTTLVKVKCQ